jgi:hypothetical protein
VGVVLMQQGHPLAFISKALGPKNQALSVYDKECPAILLAIDKWKTHLQHGPFTIHTDQRSLVHLGDHKFNTAIQKKAFFKLMGLQYKIVLPPSQCLGRIFFFEFSSKHKAYARPGSTNTPIFQNYPPLVLCFT